MINPARDIRQTTRYINMGGFQTILNITGRGTLRTILIIANGRDQEHRGFVSYISNSPYRTYRATNKIRTGRRFVRGLLYHFHRLMCGGL